MPANLIFPLHVSRQKIKKVGFGGGGASIYIYMHTYITISNHNNIPSSTISNKTSQNRYNNHVTQTTSRKQRHQLTQQNHNKIKTGSYNITLKCINGKVCRKNTLDIYSLVVKYIMYSNQKSNLDSRKTTNSYCPPLSG